MLLNSADLSTGYLVGGLYAGVGWIWSTFSCCLLLKAHFNVLVGGKTGCDHLRCLSSRLCPGPLQQHQVSVHSLSPEDYLSAVCGRGAMHSTRFCSLSVAPPDPTFAKLECACRNECQCLALLQTASPYVKGLLRHVDVTACHAPCYHCLWWCVCALPFPHPLACISSSTRQSSPPTTTHTARVHAATNIDTDTTTSLFPPEGSTSNGGQ